MKKLLIGLVLGALVTLSIGAFNALDTYHCGLLLLRAEADENATALNLTTKGDFANKPASAVQLRARPDGLGHGGNGIEVVFCGKYATRTFTYKLYAWRRGNGMARMIATGVGTLGTQGVIKYPHDSSSASTMYWADTLTVTERWVAPVDSSDTVGNNEVASIQFDFTGYEWLYCEITDADDVTGNEAGDVSAYYAYF